VNVAEDEPQPVSISVMPNVAASMTAVFHTMVVLPLNPATYSIAWQPPG